MRQVWAYYAMHAEHAVHAEVIGPQQIRCRNEQFYAAMVSCQLIKRMTQARVRAMGSCKDGKGEGRTNGQKKGRKERATGGE